jgi:CheY-like chemotaxis protein
MKTEESKERLVVWLVEDDRIYRDVLMQGLQSCKKGLKVDTFPTESLAYKAVENLEKDGEKALAPDLVICDVMLPYAFPNDDVIVPTEIAKQGEDAFRRAGVRLWKRFRKSSSSDLKKVPWIYHTVLKGTTQDLLDNKDTSTFYVGKDESFDELLQIFQELDTTWPDSDESESRYLQKSPTLKQRLFDAFKIPLKECFASLE